jgi:hypothetical protein
MRRIRLAGLNCGNILPKTVASFLSGSALQYNWSEKLKGMVLGICLARSVVLQDIARRQGGGVKKAEKSLSEFLSSQRLNLRDSSWKCAVEVLRRIGKKRFYRYRGKLVLLVDSTSYVKLRSRGKEQRMPHIGKVLLHNVPAKGTILAPGYNEFWTGLLLKDKTCLGMTRRLFTETRLRGFSQNKLEETEIQRAITLVQEAFQMKVIVVGDRGFRRKELLQLLKKDFGTDFVIRLAGKLTVSARGCDGLLQKLAPHWPERLRRCWRDDAKSPILSAVRAAVVAIPLSSRTSLRCNVLCLTPLNKQGLEPLFLASTLPIDTVEDLFEIVTLYSRRWTIETFFFSFKQSLRAEGFRVFSCWEAIDRLLAMAHIAFLILYALFVLGQSAIHGVWAKFWRAVLNRLLEWFARPPKLTLGYFFEILEKDYGKCRWAWSGG